MKDLHQEQGIARNPQAHESLPEHFYNLLQREVILCWTRRRLSNPLAGEAEANEQVISWVTDGYAAAYQVVYETKDRQHTLRASDLKNPEILEQWLVDLDAEIAREHTANA